MGNKSRGGADGWCGDPIADSVFSALENRRRRYALYVFLAQESLPAAELGDAIAGWIHVGERGGVSRAKRDDVHRSLVHRHLPVLEEAGFLHWDRETETVTRTEWSERVRALVELALEAETGSPNTPP